MKKILKFLLSRTFLFGLLIACQVGLFAALMLVFSRAGTVAYIILTLVSVLVVIAVIERDNINPAYKIMWLLIVVALPVTGAVFYLWWGKMCIRDSCPPEKKQKRAPVRLKSDTGARFICMLQPRGAVFPPPGKHRRN